MYRIKFISLVPRKINLFFSKFCIFLLNIYKNKFNLVKIYSYWYNITLHQLYLKFYCKMFYFSFINKIKTFYNNNNAFYFAKLHLKGLGFKMKKITKSLYRFYFNQVSFYYIHIPLTVIFRIKLRELFLLSTNLWDLRQLFLRILAMRKLSIYRTRGFVYPRQIINLKPGKKKY